MRIFASLLIFIPFISFAQLPELEWVSSTQGPDNCDSRDIHVDANGDVFSVGSFFGTVDFDPSGESATLIWTSEAGFLQKLDANGEFMWVKGFGFQDGELTCVAVGTDPSGNIYVAGDFYGTVDLNPGEEEEIVVSEQGERNAFIVKLDSNGDFIWARSFLSDLDCNLFDLHISADEKLYLVGEFQGTIDLDPGENVMEVTSQDFTDGYMIELNADGDYVNSIVLPNVQACRIECVQTDADGNLYLSGAFSNTVDFDPGEGVSELTSAGGSDVFVSKMGQDGTLLWARHFGGETTDNVKDLVVDRLGSVITTGYFRATADFDPGENSFEVMAAGVSGQPDGFVQKLDNQGNFAWAYTFGGVSFDQGDGLTVDVFNNVYLVGRYAAVADFLPGDEVLEYDAPGSTDGFVLGLNGADGALRYVTVTEATGNGRMGELDIDETGALFASGRFGGMADFNPDPDLSSGTSAVSTSDHFNWKLGQCVLDTVITLTDGTLSASDINGASYQWFFCDDPAIPVDGETNFIFTPEEDGSYFVEISLGNCIVPSECLEVNSLGVVENAIAEEINLYPNPASDLIHIRGGLVKSVELYDMTGKRVLASGLKDIDISILNKGVYLVRVQTFSATTVKRLVVTN